MAHLRRGYPLGALFVVVTACAVLAAGATPLVRLFFAGEEQIAHFVAAIVVGGMLGLLVGVTTGIWQFRSGLSGHGSGRGAADRIGSRADCMLPADQLSSAAAAMTVGSALIIGVALVMRQRES